MFRGREEARTKRPKPDREPFFFCLCGVVVVVLHAGGRLVPGGIASPPGSGGSTGNTGNSNSAAARRGNRRLTRNESRYHSGEYITAGWLKNGFEKGEKKKKKKENVNGSFNPRTTAILCALTVHLSEAANTRIEVKLLKFITLNNGNFSIIIFHFWRKSLWNIIHTWFYIKGKKF